MPIIIYKDITLQLLIQVKVVPLSGMVGFPGYIYSFWTLRRISLFIDLQKKRCIFHTTSTKSPIRGLFTAFMKWQEKALCRKALGEKKELKIPYAA